MQIMLAANFSILPSLTILLLVVFVLAAWAKVRAAEAEAAHPPTGVFLSAGGYRIHHISRGLGPPLIYIHGAQGSTADLTLSPTFAALAEHFTVIAYDRPGFGHTRREDRHRLGLPEQARILQRFIDELKLSEKPVIVGHSLGASIALQHAADFPDASCHCILVSAVAYGWGGGATFLERIATLPILGDLIVAALILPLGPGAAQRALYEAFAGGEIPAEFAARTTALALRPSQYRFTALDMPSLSQTLDALSPRYPQIIAPLTIVHGGKDSICPASYHATRLHAAVPHSRLVLLPEAPHELQFTDAAAIVEAAVWSAGSAKPLAAGDSNLPAVDRH